MLITFDLNAVSSRSKTGETIEEYLYHRSAVCKYFCIMSAVVPQNSAFQYDFSSFYVMYRLKKEKRSKVYAVFDDYIGKNKSEHAYRDILQALKDEQNGTGRVEKSFASKMLHTLNPDEPIIDSIVLKSLKDDPNTAPYINEHIKTTYTISDAVNLHNAIKTCYNDYLIPHAKSVGYFDAFDKAFPYATNISEVKKIDFYLWAM